MRSEQIEIETTTKPSDFPRDERFGDPRTPPFQDEPGLYHVLSYADVMRVLMNREQAVTRDPAPWLPPGPHRMALDFMLYYAREALDDEEASFSFDQAEAERIMDARR